MQPLYDITRYSSGPSFQRGRTLLLLGTSKNGPVNEPVLVNSLDRAEKVFGKEGSLYQAFERAYRVDSSITIYLMRVTGEHASCVLWGTETDFGQQVPLLRLSTIYGGEAYNQMTAMITNDDEGNACLMLTYPAESAYPNKAYVLKDFDTLNMLVKEINEDTRMGESCVHANTRFLDRPAMTLAAWNDIEHFTGGVDGTDATKNDIFLALEYAYSLLEGYYIDYVCPVDARFDDTHPAAYYGSAIYGTSIYEADRDYLSLQDSADNNRMVTFHKQLIDFCKKQIAMGCMTHGIIGLNVIKDPTDLEKHEYSYIVKLLETAGFKDRHGLAVFRNGEWVDSGYYISITAGEQIYNEGSEDEYFENIAVSYSAMLAALPTDATPTNRKISNDAPLRYQFTSGELAELSHMGIVAPRDSVRHGVVIANGVTAAVYNNDMHSTANLRQVQLVLSFLNEAIDEYVGQPILPLIQRGTLQKVIEKVLESLKIDGLLIDYRYNLEYDEIRGNGTLSVDLMAKNMIDYVSATAGLKFAAVGGM
jgi:hypothetical protein